jgi:hypothetical protein
LKFHASGASAFSPGCAVSRCWGCLTLCLHHAASALVKGMSLLCLASAENVKVRSVNTELCRRFTCLCLASHFSTGKFLVRILANSDETNVEN